MSEIFCYRPFVLEHYGENRTDEPQGNQTLKWRESGLSDYIPLRRVVWGSVGHPGDIGIPLPLPAPHGQSPEEGRTLCWEDQHYLVQQMLRCVPSALDTARQVPAAALTSTQDPLEERCPRPHDESILHPESPLVPQSNGSLRLCQE